MSIPHHFDPMGTAGGESWTTLDMSTFATSTWAEGEIVPLGRPNNREITTRRCTRSAEARVLYFGYNSAATAYNVNYNYGYYACPPRQTTRSATPAVEIWYLGDPSKMRVTLELSSKPTRASCTTDDWTTYNANIPVADNGDGSYTVTAPACRALALHIDGVNALITGEIIKIELCK